MPPARKAKLSDSAIIDRIGALGVEVERLHAEKRALCQELINRGFQSGDGENFHATVIAATIRWNFDRKRFEDTYGEQMLRPFLNPSTVSSYIRTHALPHVVAQLVAAE